MDTTPVRTRRRLPQDPADVWDRLTSDDGFEQWMGPGSTIEPRPGGKLVAADTESGEPKTGEVLEVDPGRRLMWAWRPLGSPVDTSSVEIELARPADTTEVGTEVTVTERRTVVEVPWLTDVPQACSTGVAGCRRH